MGKLSALEEEIQRMKKAKDNIKAQIGEQNYQMLEKAYQELAKDNNIHPAILSDFFTLRYEIEQVERVLPLY